MRRAIASVEASAAARRCEGLPGCMKQLLGCLQIGEEDVHARDRLLSLCSLVEDQDLRLVAGLKVVVRGGVQVFEQYQDDAIRAGGCRLLAAIREVPRVLEAFYTALDERLEDGRAAHGAASCPQ
jgi:hypothetical protein